MLFMAFLFGGSMFILITGYVHAEAERAKGIPAVARAPVSRFLVEPEPESAEPAASIDDAVVAGVAQFLADEQTLAAEFVARPSVGNLLSRVERPVREASLSRYLAKERAAVAEFLAGPSVEVLYRRVNGVAWRN